MLSRIVQQRYLAPTWPHLVDRILSGPIWKRKATVRDTESLYWALSEKIFIPAGNTLTFNAHNRSALTEHLRPNCAIWASITPDDAVRVWSEGTGFGTTVIDADENPVEHIHKLQEAWDRFQDPGHRPKRGNMYVYPAHGKYVMDFIALKSDVRKADKIPGFNISVGFHDFEQSVKDNSALLPAIAEAAWQTGDPGVVFLDRVNGNMPFIHHNKRISTLVPCGEQGMYDHESCTLGSINLNANDLCAGGKLSYTKLERAIRVAVRFLDLATDSVRTSVHTSNLYRRIGLGVMGWADLLDRYGFPYGSKESHELARDLSGFFGAIARHESGRISVEQGHAFPAWYRERIDTNFATERQDVVSLHRHDRADLAYEVMRDRPRWGMRNVSVTCIAPTGGINLITENRGFSIEPAFEDAARIDYATHIRMADDWQSGMCNSVSKTINFPNSADVQDIYDAILFARNESKLKALSMYRMGSRENQPM
jgi:ribonucleoside-diphosphate reductase alpha chain